MKEDWIKSAFNLARKESSELIEATEYVESFLAENEEQMLDNWAATMPLETIDELTEILRDEKISEALSGLCGSFFLTGYMLGKTKEND